MSVLQLCLALALGWNLGLRAQLYGRLSPAPSDSFLQSADNGTAPTEACLGRQYISRLRWHASSGFEPRHFGVLVHGLQVDDPRLENAHAVEELHDGLVHLEAGKRPRREQVLPAQADGDALPDRAPVSGA